MSHLIDSYSVRKLKEKEIVRRFILQPLFRIKRALTRSGRSKTASVQQNPRSSFQSFKKIVVQAARYLQAALARLNDSIIVAARQPKAKRAVKFVKRYSTQLSFAILVTVFLTVTVGEGQAFDVETPSLAAQLETGANGFIGKPQVFGGQTISTGEEQQFAVIIYKVEKGDSLSSIASRYNLSVGTILDENHINARDAEKIKIGDELIIPAEDKNTSLAWLSELNKAKEEERVRAEAERQKRLAQQRRSTSSSSRTTVASSAGNITSLGSEWGPYNGGFPGQCTWLVNKYRNFPGRMGNGNQYMASARSYGIATGKIAQVGAVIQTYEGGRYGHVGYVRSVTATTVTFEEMNYLGPGRKNLRTLSLNDRVIAGYVY